MMVAVDRELERRNRGELIRALEEAGCVVRGPAARCPFHDDRTPSGSIHQDAAGVWRFTCHAPACGFSGDVFDVRARAAGRPLADVLPRAWPPPAETRKSPRVHAGRDSLRTAARYAGPKSPPLALEAEYTNCDPDTGAVELVIFRLRDAGGKKSFRYAHPTPAGWVLAKPPGTQPLYNRRRVRAADVVVFVEGEKCVHAVTDLGVPAVAATTCHGGSAKGVAEGTDLTPLAGKRVYLWPDNDPPGLDHMGRVAGLLESVADVHWIDPGGLGLGVGGDVADLLGRTPDAERELDAALATARPHTPSRSLHQLIRDTVSGRREAVPWPWPELHRRTRCLLPGTLTVLCGGEGGSKSFFALACCWRWHTDGRKVAYLALEREHGFHLQRLLAHLDGTWDYLDDEWIRGNGAAIEAAYGRRRRELDAFAPLVTAPHCAKFGRQDALDWLAGRCAGGCRVAVIDPVTMLSDAGDVWTADADFVSAARSIAHDAGASVILVTHPRTGAKGRGMEPLESLAGGAAYRRFTDAVLWLQKPKREKSGTVRTAAGLGCRQYNRVLHLLKTRDGSGQGVDLAYCFGEAGPSFSEAGAIEEE
jgi:hypothetical protein